MIFGLNRSVINGLLLSMLWSTARLLWRNERHNMMGELQHIDLLIRYKVSFAWIIIRWPNYVRCSTQFVILMSTIECFSATTNDLWGLSLRWECMNWTVYFECICSVISDKERLQIKNSCGYKVTEEHNLWFDCWFGNSAITGTQAI